MQRTVGRWLIEHDPDVTRRCFAQLPAGTRCTCNECRNFDAAAGRTFPDEFSALTSALGVDPTKPAELCTIAYREPSGLYLIGGWFHFVGSILSGDDALHWENNTGTYRLEKLTPAVEFGFSARLVLVPEAFVGLPLVQLEFQTRVPWVRAEPSP